MIRRLLPTLALTLGLASAAPADFTTTFETAGLGPNSAVNDAGPSGSFVFDGNAFNNSHVVSGGFEFWSGWSISTMADNKTAGFGNQYSAITGSGFGGSATYAVAFDDPFSGLSYINLASAPVSLEIANTAYAYYSIKNGDTFSRPFGAGDFFTLDIRGFSGLGGAGSQVGSTISVSLADFTNGLSFILDSWSHVDLTSLAGAQSLIFGLRSSDVGPNGINTPTYFALDNLVVASPTAVPEPASLALVASGLLGVVAVGRKWTRAAL